MAKTDKYQKRTPKRFTYLALGILLISISSSLQGTTQTIQIPSLAEAARQADQLAPKDLTQIEVDESIRDRLRFDPEWQPILQGVRRDMMVLKWGNGKLVNPAWKQYGPKIYPLLDYYIRSGDPTREAYGMLGLRALGKPYTTLWLERQLQKRVTSPNFDLVTTNNGRLLNPNSARFDDEYDWQQMFGLSDPAIRDRLIQIAQKNLKPEKYFTYQGQFNLDFLKGIKSEEATNNWSGSPPEFNPESNPKLQKWLDFEKLKSPDKSQIQAAVVFYRALSDEDQLRILVDRLGSVKAGDISIVGRAVLLSIATDAMSQDRIFAIAELDRHGDPRGVELLSKAINGNLNPLHNFTESTGAFANSRYSSGHVLYLLFAIAKKYPQSRFMRGCVEYGDLRGKSYFGDQPRNKAIRSKNATKTTAERAQDWQQWLSRYPDHPGADDATYFLATGLENENNPIGAMNQWIRMMTRKMGDGDALYLAWPHVRSLLDVGLSVDQLKTLTKEQHDSAIAPLVKYALAVQQARIQNYADALTLTEGLDLTKMPSSVLKTYYGTRWSPKPEEIQKNMQSMLVEQRERWQALSKFKIDNNPEALYRIASNWSGSGGWKNGYLPFWDNDRVNKISILDFRSCKKFWVCNLAQRNIDTVRTTYQNSNSNAVALSLYQKILTSSRTSQSLREKTLFMVASTLINQWEIDPRYETISIFPPPGLTGESQTKKIWEAENNSKIAWDKYWLEAENLESGEGSEAAKKQAEEIANKADKYLDETKTESIKTIQQSYQRSIDEIINLLQRDFPQSTYTDDLLFSNYFFSGQRQYLEQIVKLYPNGDRAAEANFLLGQSQRSFSKRDE